MIIRTKMIAIILFVFAYGSLVGYFVHRLMHSKLFMGLAKIHKIHHLLYTTNDFESETYRSAGKDTSSFVFVPIITIAIMLLCIGMLIFHSWWIYPIILAEGIIVGYLNDRLHDYFHITNHWLNKYHWFRVIKQLHWNHHDNPEVNHGIIWFIPDKIFGTFKNENSATQRIT